MGKVTLRELIDRVSLDAFKEALLLTKRSYGEITDRDMMMMLGLTDAQYERFVKTTLNHVLNKKLTVAMIDALTNGDSINLPRQFELRVYTSGTRMNENGTPFRKMSIKTKEQMSNRLNKQPKNRNEN